MTTQSPGLAFKHALRCEQPLQIVGVINAYSALLAQQAGFKALYLSGAAVANGCFALPDLAMTGLPDVLTEAQRMTQACALPLLVDVDTGFGHELVIARMVTQMIQAGVAAIQLEDQVSAKRCGHRPGKQLVAPEEMQARIRAAVAARTDPDFIIMARTDAYRVEGLRATIERALTYQAVGADMLFAESFATLADYQQLTDVLDIPVLANMTEFGQTPLFTCDALASVGVAMSLYPLSAFRAMNFAAQKTFDTIRQHKTQASLLPQMQTRQALYDLLNYETYEQRLNKN